MLHWGTGNTSVCRGELSLILIKIKQKDQTPAFDQVISCRAAGTRMELSTITGKQYHVLIVVSVEKK